MRTYGAKNPDRQIKISPIPSKSQFASFNARQIFPLYGMYVHVYFHYIVTHLFCVDVVHSCL